MEPTLQEIGCTYLKNEGFPTTTIEEDGEVVFKCEGKYYVMHMHQDFPERFTLALPAFWPLEDPDEAARALSVANKVNLRVYGATVVCVNDTVTAFVELFLANPAEDIKAVFYRSLKALQSAAYYFATLMDKGQPPEPPSGGGVPVGAHTGNGAELLGGYL